jgi:hypothetical protein
MASAVFGMQQVDSFKKIKCKATVKLLIQCGSILFSLRSAIANIKSKTAKPL